MVLPIPMALAWLCCAWYPFEWWGEGYSGAAAALTRSFRCTLSPLPPEANKPPTEADAEDDKPTLLPKRFDDAGSGSGTTAIGAKPSTVTLSEAFEMCGRGAQSSPEMYEKALAGGALSAAWRATSSAVCGAGGTRPPPPLASAKLTLLWAATCAGSKSLVPAEAADAPKPPTFGTPPVPFVLPPPEEEEETAAWLWTSVYRQPCATCLKATRVAAEELPDAPPEPTRRDTTRAWPMLSSACVCERGAEALRNRPARVRPPAVAAGDTAVPVARPT